MRRISNPSGRAASPEALLPAKLARAILLLAALLLPSLSSAAAPAPASAISADPARDPDLVSLRSILAPTLRTLGGVDKLRAVKAVAFAGKGQAFGEYGALNARFEHYVDSRGRLRTLVSTHRYQLERVLSPLSAWERQSWAGHIEAPRPHVRQLAPFAARRFASDALIFPLLLYSEEGRKGRVRSDKGEDGRAVRTVDVLNADGSLQERWLLDAATHLPLERSVPAEFDTGGASARTRFSDFRSVGGLKLPFRIVRTSADVASIDDRIEVETYRLNEPLPDPTFAYPLAAAASAPLKPVLRSVPGRIYKEHDQLTASREPIENPRWAFWVHPTETWYFDLLLDEEQGRWLDPVQATVTLFSGSRPIRSLELSREDLLAARRLNLNRGSGVTGISVFRQHHTAPITLEVDRIRYELALKDANGRPTRAGFEADLFRPDQKTKLVFPVKGRFLALSAHGWDDVDHNDEASQFGAYDIVPVGPRGEILKDLEGKVWSFVDFGHDIVAPADGSVVLARGDLPNLVPLPKDMIDLDTRSDQVAPWEGNVIVIDHGHGEFSFLCHLAEGSVAVKTGDRVRQGQPIAKLGGSARPVGGEMFPHLHYQLMRGPHFGGSDGMPSRFENLETLNFFGGAGQKVETPKKGNFYVAR